MSMNQHPTRNEGLHPCQMTLRLEDDDLSSESRSARHEKRIHESTSSPSEKNSSEAAYGSVHREKTQSDDFAHEYEEVP